MTPTQEFVYLKEFFEEFPVIQTKEFFGKFLVYCTICGNRYYRSPHMGFSKSQTCSAKCHREHDWRRTLAIMNNKYSTCPIGD